jgi:ADP-dependent NAD(P)H-hydrate dehydratase / NAD(P)H-hydrate epimerase
MKTLTAEEMKEIDRLSTERANIPSLTLMENAGRGVAEFIRARYPDLAQRHIVVLCGKGNNGGDGFVAARHLLRFGASPDAVLCAAPADVTGDALENMKKWQTLAGELHVIASQEDWDRVVQSFGPGALIVDALLGTGTRGAIEGPLQMVIHDVNKKRPPRSVVVAVDVPSGLIADTGEVAGEAMVADHTVTFTAPKIGMLMRSAGEYVGKLHVWGIGSPLELIEETGKGSVRWLEALDFEAFSRPRKADSNKGDFGHALIVAGAVGKSGAAVLASWAALRAGAGLATVATPEPVLQTVAAHNPEVMTEPLAATEAGSISQRSLENGYFEALLKKKRTLAIGPGLGTHGETQEFIRAAVKMKAGAKIILDADGLNAFAGRAAELCEAGEAMAITPHPGEMARLTGGSIAEVQANRVETAKKAAADWNVIVVLKGQQTVIAAPDGRVAVNSTGNAGMATGGTGDVLTGILAGLAAQYAERDFYETVCFGVYLHGLAGDICYDESGESPLMASDLIKALPRALKQFRGEIDRG